MLIGTDDLFYRSESPSRCFEVGLYMKNYMEMTPFYIDYGSALLVDILFFYVWFEVHYSLIFVGMFFIKIFSLWFFHNIELTMAPISLWIGFMPRISRKNVEIFLELSPIFCVFTRKRSMAS